jgi:hypothetical protein
MPPEYHVDTMLMDAVKKECRECKWCDEDTCGAPTCRRHAPITLEDKGAHRVWPFIYLDDWCGDWEMRG